MCGVRAKKTDNKLIAVDKASAMMLFFPGTCTQPDVQTAANKQDP